MQFLDSSGHRHISSSQPVSSDFSGKATYSTLCQHWDPDHSRPCSPVSQQVTIEHIADNVLLIVFRHYLDACPRLWPRLVHVCRKWRRIVFASRQALRLQLSCTHRTPVLKTLECWPDLPIVVQHGGFPVLDSPAPEDEHNIVAALQSFDRINSISLTLTRSLLEKVRFDKPFVELEDLVLLSQNNVHLTLPSTFRWGPRLRGLQLTRIAFPTLLPLLSSSRNLVDIQLHDISGIAHLSPETLANTLSGMSHLQSLSLSSLSTPHRQSYVSQVPVSVERIVLPALTHLKLRGASDFLDKFLARIDSSCLENTKIAFKECHSNISNYGEIIRWIETQKSFRRADILSFESTISISFSQPSAPTCLELQVSCGTLDQQLSIMAMICRRLSTFLFGVEDLRINATPLLGGQDNLYGENWANLICSFERIKCFHIAGDLATDIVRALRSYRMGPREMRRAPGPPLPALLELYVKEPGPSYAPLREAVVLLMMSRRLSGRPIHVAYEQPYISKHDGTGCFSQQRTIELLSDDIILNIFRHFLDESPWFWPMLTHVCQTWREVVLASPKSLHLRLFCKHGTSLSKAQDCWPSLPIVVHYGGPSLGAPAPEDEDDIVAALKHYDRVSSITLTLTSSLLEKFSAIEEPFSELEELVLLSKNTVQLALPSSFRWGSRLRTLHTTGIAFPSFPQLLLPSINLVEIQLQEIPGFGYFSPETFANALSGMTRLQKLLLDFLSLPPHNDDLGLPPLPEERVGLPALIHLRYQGTSKFLDCLVARIDAPSLRDIGVTFSRQPIMDVSQLRRFVDRIEVQRVHTRANITTSPFSVSISFTQLGYPALFKLQILCSHRDGQLSSVAQICNQFSPSLFRVKNLHVKGARPLRQHAQYDNNTWLEVIRAFGGMEELGVSGRCATDIFSALRSADGEHTDILPALRELLVPEIESPSGPLWEAAKSFIMSRWSSHHSLRSATFPALCGNEALLKRYFCAFCDVGFLQRAAFDQHRCGDLIACSYCGDFKWPAGHKDLFRKHLENKHVEVRCPRPRQLAKPPAPGRTSRRHR